MNKILRLNGSPVVRSMVARSFGFPVSFLASLSTTGIIIREHGTGGFALYATINSLLLLLPVADLGIGAVIMNILGPRVYNVQVHQTLALALRATAFISILLVITAILGAVTSLWSLLLGPVFSASTANLAVMLTISAFAFSLVSNLGIRGLNALGRNTMVSAFQSLSPVAVTALTATSAALHVPEFVYPVIPTMVSLIVGAICCILLSKTLAPSAGSSPTHTLTSILQSAFLRRLTQASPILATGMSAMIIQLAGPISIQSDRLIIGHSSAASGLATYSMQAQLFFPLMILTGTAGTALWASYAADGRSAASHTKVLKASAFLGGAIAVAIIGLMIAGPVIVQVVSNSALRFDPFLGLSLGLYCIVQAIWTPFAMFQTDLRGLRFQALQNLVMCIANIAISLWLVEQLGISGPALASGITVLVFMLVPGVVRFYILSATASGAG